MNLAAAGWIQDREAGHPLRLRALMARTEALRDEMTCPGSPRHTAHTGTPLPSTVQDGWYNGITAKSLAASQVRKGQEGTKPEEP